MARFALVCPPFPSHIRVFEALAGRLEARGHESVFVLNAGAERFVRPGRRVLSVGAVEGLDPAGLLRRAARPTGPLGILRTVSDTAALTEALCRDAPGLLREVRPDVLVGDEMEPAAGLVAASLGLPFVSVAAALPVETVPGMPPPYLGWPYDPSRKGLKRNRGGARIAKILLTEQRRTIEAWAERFGLRSRSTLTDCLSPTLRLSQTVAGFDFPRPPSPIFHAVGPIREAPAASAAPLPFTPDPGRPLVFASLGTLQGHRLGLFRAMAEGCRSVGASLVVSHCGGLSDEEAASLDADHVFADLPQAAVLARASVCITHGGMNTVMDALAAGVPMLCLPIAFDQPGVAARIVHHGVGLRSSRVLLSPRRIASSLDALLASSAFRNRAAAIGREIAASGGADLAADLIEGVLPAEAASWRATELA
ncbi:MULTISPECIES: glycosyltransferase [unclassified Aureimonas]|uniref:glycosyltransferase n=1 Tax=unclassified Aureimonas TaxID=2615206 RepID=UPI0006F52B01|nr:MULTISPECIES: glycosyltransferase [unclassified Aureimonas]KQT69695.1 hypothetical protein ASG62_00770 [Aureimonas sp. Leaf427]KQT76152.1 hypothetical protein ASG54_15450 [Aureimonas sp. Leaf460]